MTPHEKLPRQAWALMDGDALATHDGRLPLFWCRSVAHLGNSEWLEGTGRIIRVEVRAAPRQKRKAKP